MNQVSFFAWTESAFRCGSVVSSRALKRGSVPDAPPLKDLGAGGGGFFCIFLKEFYSDKSRNLSKILPVLLSALVKRVGVSRMRDLFLFLFIFFLVMPQAYFIGISASTRIG